MKIFQRQILMREFPIKVFRKKELRRDLMQFDYYSSVSVKELKSYGYNLIGYSDEEVVFLDIESYKNFMSLQAYCVSLNKIDNTVSKNPKKRRK